MRAGTRAAVLGALGLAGAGAAVLPAWFDAGLAAAWLQLLTLCR